MTKLSLVVRFPGLRCRRFCNESSLPEIVTIDHDGGVRVKPNVFDVFSDSQGPKMLNDVRGCIRLPVLADRGRTARVLAERRNEPLRDVDNGEPRGDGPTVAEVNDLMGRVQLVEQARSGLAVFRHD